MLRIDSKNMNLSGASVVNDVTIATFTASINNPDPNVYLSASIMDKDQFHDNLSAVQNDMSEFIAEVAQAGQ